MTDNASTPRTGNEPVENAQRVTQSDALIPDGTGGSDHGPAIIIPFPTCAAAPDTGPTSGATDPGEEGEGGKGASASPPSPPSAAPVPEDVPAAPPAPLGDDVYQPAPDTNPVVDALARRGIYRRAVGGSEHRITCPWKAEHAPGEPSEATYFAPSDAVPLGTFRCLGRHDGKRRMGTLLTHLEVDRDAARGKPWVTVKVGEAHRVAGAAEKALAARGGFFRSNDMVVRLKIDSDTGDVSLDPLNEHTLALELSAAADWRKFDARREEIVRCDVPTNVVTALYKSKGMGHLPELKALVRQPYLRRDDRMLVRSAGYDPATGVYAAFDPDQFRIPLLTRENALVALRRLDALLGEFEFASEADRSASICAMLTASIRDSLKVAPGFNISASSSGSGKSYLAALFAPFAGPGEARNISYPGTNEEATKVVLSLALEQPAAVCFDDMPTDWLPHGAMNRMLTNGMVTERILGSSKVVTARAASFVTGTGNNIRPLRDMARRVASIYLLPQVETAAMREFAGDPVKEVRANRGRYVSDALTIVAAWKAAGSPKADVPNIAGFEEWSDLCRHSLIWLGQPDPATSLIEQIAHDPDKEQLGNLLDAWRDRFGQKATLVRQVVKLIDDDKHSDLHAAVMELPCVERGYVNQSRFGRYLARNKNRIVDGFKLVEAEHSERRAWAVVPVSPQAKQPVPAAPAGPPDGIERMWLDQMLERGASIPALSEQGSAFIQ